MGRLSALFMPNLNVLCRTFISKGELAYGYSHKVKNPSIILSVKMQPLGEGARQSRRMDGWVLR